MAKSIDQIIKELNAFNPDDHVEPGYELDKILEDFKSIPDREAAIPEMFALLERFPDGDFGCPGPIVHHLEAIPDRGYESELAASLARTPTLYNLWMVNRILNSEKNPQRYEFWHNQLTLALTHPNSGEFALKNAQLFLDHQQEVQEEHKNPKPAKPTKTLDPQTVDEAISHLNAFQPDEFANSDELLQTIAEKLAGMQDHPRAYPSMWALVERFPDYEARPIGDFLRLMPPEDFAKALLESLTRTPSVTTVNEINVIAMYLGLNPNQHSLKKLQRWLDQMTIFLNHPKLTAAVRTEIQNSIMVIGMTIQGTQDMLNPPQ
jgi:hypothetical protein